MKTSSDRSVKHRDKHSDYVAFSEADTAYNEGKMIKYNMYV